MLQIRNLTILHKKDYRELLKDFSFALNPGDKAVIIGEEGNGKSTLLKWIYDPELVDGYAEVSGERMAHGERLGYLAQELPVADREKSLYEYFSEDMTFWDQTPGDLSRLAAGLGLAADFFYGEQKLGTLSGGEKVKAQMARLLIADPTVFLLDEPSNDIDIETLEWLEQWIKESDRPVLFVSHDETLIENTANVVIHIEQLKRKTESHYTGARLPYRQYMEERLNRLDRQEQQALNDRREEKIRQEKFRRIQQKVEHEQNAISRQDPHGGQLLKKKMKAVKSLEHRYEREAEQMTQMPETEEAIFFKFGEDIRIPAGKTVLEYECKELYAPVERSELSDFAANNDGTKTADQNHGRLLSKDIFLRVKGGEKICIIGSNGAGKTTLLRQIAAELLERKDIHAEYMPQNYEELLDLEKTPVEYLSVTGEKEEITRIRTYLGSMKYTADEMSHPIDELSGGQKAKVLLLKMSMSGADVLILDEPTRNFSPLSGPVIRQVLEAYGGVIISISHDRKYIGQVCHTTYRLTPEGLFPVPVS